MHIVQFIYFIQNIHISKYCFWGILPKFSCIYSKCYIYTSFDSIIFLCCSIDSSHILWTHNVFGRSNPFFCIFLYVAYFCNLQICTNEFLVIINFLLKETILLFNCYLSRTEDDVIKITTGVSLLMVST